jgi:hypothetical protein
MARAVLDSMPWTESPALTPPANELVADRPTSWSADMAHQYLLQRQLPLLLRGTAPRLVVTSSEVHDPTTAGGKVGQPAGLADLAGLR